MTFFSKKKEEKKLSELPPLKFPEFPREEIIPSSEKILYNQETDQIKNAVQSFPTQQLEKPIMREERRETPVFEPQQYPNRQQGETLFVRIENFRDAKEKMEKVKEKVAETERILEKIDQLRKEEEAEMRIWHQDLSAIKSKLLEIDKKIFE